MTCTPHPHQKNPPSADQEEYHVRVLILKLLGRRNNSCCYFHVQTRTNQSHYNFIRCPSMCYALYFGKEHSNLLYSPYIWMPHSTLLILVLYITRAFTESASFPMLRQSADCAKYAIKVHNKILRTIFWTPLGLKKSSCNTRKRDPDRQTLKK